MSNCDLDFESLGLPDLRPTRGVQTTLSELFDGALVPGLHLAVNQSFLPHWHHGIYIGKEAGKHTIVDMWGPDKRSASITRRSIDDFLNGANTICIIEYDVADSVELRTAAVSRAMATMRHEASEPLYDLFLANCECFAFWCCTGCCAAVADARLFSHVQPYRPGLKGY